MAKKATAPMGEEGDVEALARAQEELLRRIGQFHLPRWAELPDFDIYMDQLLLLVERALAPVASPDDRPLTASMVNNYVKARVLPPVRGKRYGREHTCMLLAVCLAKRAFSIARVTQMADVLVAGSDVGASYDAMCDLFEGRLRAVAGLPPAASGGRIPDATRESGGPGTAGLDARTGGVARAAAPGAGGAPDAGTPADARSALLPAAVDALANVIYLDDLLALSAREPVTDSKAVRAD